MTPLRRAWQYRELLWQLIVRNLRVKYKRSLLGFFWTLLQPLTTVSVLVAIFTRVVPIPIERYWAFLLSGYFVWNFLQQSINAGTFVVAEHARLVRNVAFPTELLAFGAVLSRFVEFLVEFTLIAILLSLMHHGAVPASYAFLPVLFLIQLVLALGLCLPLATLSAYYSDVQHALPIVLMTLFYVSPVFYPVSMVPDHMLTAYLANPIAQVLTLYHSVMYEGRAPSGWLTAITALSATLLALSGYAIFMRHRSRLAELV